MMLLPACSAKDGREKNNNSAKFDQYYIQGEELYLNHCSNCHQKDGSGLGLIYPPLNQSDFMDNNFTKVICLIRHGQRGEIIVNGKNFNKEMPAIPTLTDLEIAEIATYIYNTWSHQRGIVAVKEVSVILSTCQKDSTSAHK
ncbi:MAG TPA: cytochrome c [Ohtaekwangia sp.]|nr:cytochrome c [Ohtaekwangia sp.]